ncbi:DUF5677 domain-containing protein [Desulforamulus ruminis]|uniref:DUF5677 domain-containing protein n=1 Tax=Desulforamulus ruminis TaxID=1564 RepID=UPI002FD9F28A
MEHSKLSDHKFKKGKFIAPWNELMSELDKEASWYHGRLPEYFWLALILDYYGREDGLIKCYKILKKMRQLAPHFSTPRLSQIFELNDEVQKELYSVVLDTVSSEVIAPLTTIFTYSKYPCFATTFCVAGLSVDERINKISCVMKKSSDHQTHFSTDIRFVVLYFELLSRKLHMPKEVFNLILEYPSLSHDDEKMRIIRPTIRSAELAQTAIEQYNENYLNLFWEEVSRMSDCKLFFVDLTEDIPDTEDYLTQAKSILSYYSELMISSRPLDNKMLVLLGIATYSYKRLLELVKHQLFFTISGRSIARVLIENYIMMKYLLQEEANHKDIWTEYQYYGIGQYKLIVERIRESGKELPNSHVLVDYLDILVGEYKNKEFIDMDTSYFDKKNVREKAISVGEKELFGFYYDYDSAFEHGLWGAIRESSLVKCNSPAHQYHCVPDIENHQKMKSVWKDCLNTMNKIFIVLEDIYGCPAHLRIEAE